MVNKKLSYEERIMRSNLMDIKLKRMPQITNRPIPVLKYCQKCKKRRVTSHHWLCNKCWKEKQVKGGQKNGFQRKFQRKTTTKN